MSEKEYTYQQVKNFDNVVGDIVLQTSGIDLKKEKDVLESIFVDFTKRGGDPKLLTNKSAKGKEKSEQYQLLRSTLGKNKDLAKLRPNKKGSIDLAQLHSLSTRLQHIAAKLESQTGKIHLAKKADTLAEHLDQILRENMTDYTIVGCPHGCADLTDLTLSILSGGHPVNMTNMKNRMGTNWVSRSLRKINSGSLTADRLDEIIHEEMK